MVCRAAIVTIIFSRFLSASEARFTEELWVPIEALYQDLLASHRNAASDQRDLLARTVRETLTTLASKAPDTDWRRFLIEDAGRITTLGPAPRMTRATGDYAAFLSTAVRKSFGEGLAAILAEYWIDFERRKDRGEIASNEFVEQVAQLTRLVNSLAAREHDAGRARLKNAFSKAAHLKVAFEEQ